MNPFLEVEFLNEVSPLASIEASNDIEILVLESQSGMEVPPGIEVSDLAPLVRCHIVNFALVHAFGW